MKAVIFKEISKLLLKEEHREGQPDILTRYRTDSFGSSSNELKYAKVYGYKDGIINGKVPSSESYIRMFIKPQVESIDWFVNEIVEGNMSEEMYELTDSVKMGYMLINDEDCEYCPKDDCKIQEKYYTHEVKYNRETEKTEVIDISLYEEREKVLKDL